MTYVVATIVTALAVLGLAAGVVIRNRPLRGSCGGLANLRDQVGNLTCEACDHPSPDCTEDAGAR
jgi:hypothetical protein